MTSAFKEYWAEPGLIIITIVHCATVIAFVDDMSPAVSVKPPHYSLRLNIQQLTRRHWNKFSVTPMLISASQKSSKVSPLVGRFTQAWWHFARQLQLCCLSWLNPFISCLPTNLHDRQQLTPCLDSCFVMHMNHVNIPEYTKHFRAYSDLGSQGATNARYM